MKIRLLGSLVMVFALIAQYGSAARQTPGIAVDRTVEVEGRPGGVDFAMRIQSGHLTGEANEYVYGYGRTISQLIWETDSLYMAGVGATLKLGRWVSLQGDVWSKITDGEGTMNDYDWLYSTGAWSHWSQHDDTDVTKGTIVDLSGAVFPLQMLEKYHLSLSGLLGFRMENYEWEARGGTYVYSSNGGFRDLSGDFTEGELGITYEQLFYYPYLGLDVAFLLGRFEGGMRLIGSPAVFGEAKAQHHLRDLETHADLEWGRMYAVSLSVAYHFCDYVGLSTSLSYTEYDTITANSTYTWTNSDGSKTTRTYDDGEGASLQTAMASLAVTIGF